MILMNLDNGISQAQEASCAGGETDMARQKFKVTLTDGTVVWLTGNTVSEAFCNGLKKYGGQAKEAPKRKTFEAYVKEWLGTYKAKKLKPTTLKGYSTMLHSHVLPAFGKRFMDEITVKDIQTFLNEREHLSAKYLKDMKIFIGSVFRDAVEDHVAQENPATSRRITIPSTKKNVREALTVEQFRNILGNLYRLPARSRRMVALMMLTGARRGEVLGLQWEDIDWNVGLIYIRRNVTYPKNQPLVGTTKTKNGVRSIPLVEELTTLLDHKDETGYIIADRSGDEPISMMAYRRMWETIEATIELYGATAHIFRHTYLTLIAGTGTDVKTLQAIAGHGDIQVTMNRYVHPQTENIVKAGQSLERLIG